MFYVKAHLPDDVTLTTEIRNDNVFTRCPCCGEEVKVDLVELLGDGKSNLEGTTVYCQACSRRKVGFDLPITLDGITWLTAVLSESGYGSCSWICSTSSELSRCETFLKAGIRISGEHLRKWPRITDQHAHPKMTWNLPSRRNRIWIRNFGHWPSTRNSGI